MISLLFFILMFMVFGKLIVFAIKMTWGILKVVLFVVFLPLILVAMFLGGLSIAAFALLLIVGLISLIVCPIKALL